MLTKLIHYLLCLKTIREGFIKFSAKNYLDGFLTIIFITKEVYTHSEYKIRSNHFYECDYVNKLLKL